MSQSGKNGDILSFFKPVSSRPKTPQSPQKSSLGSPSPLPPSSPFSQRTSPVKLKLPLTRDTVIKASDDEDDLGSSSDDSLEDLSTILGRGRPSNAIASPSRQAQNPYATPRAKRTAVGFHSSPLAFLPKHKFDLKALAKDARKDDATNASSLKVKDATDRSEDDDDFTSGGASRNAFEGIVKEKGGQDAQKVLRAVQRTEGGHTSVRYCFFRQDYTPPPSRAAPKSISKGPWKLLTQGDVYTREQHIASGLPMTLLSIHGGFPDEVFDWILDEVCVTQSSLLQEEYCNLLGQSAEQVERLVTPERLEALFLCLGACDDIKERDADLHMMRSHEEPYKKRNWGNVKTFLLLIKHMAPCMTLSSVAYAARILFRLSIDTVIVRNIDLFVEYEGAIQALVEAVPRPSWDLFVSGHDLELFWLTDGFKCFEMCSSLHKVVKTHSLRTNALACLPASKTSVHELRRRLAVTCLFDDPALGRNHSDTTVSLRGIIDRLQEDDFVVGPKTDFVELQAGIILLDIAVDNGSFVASDDPEDERKFNEEIDELAVRLREIWRKINDAGMKLARTEAKSVIEWVQQRLSHSVRTRRKAKKSVFDLPGQKEDPFLPRQQDYMKNFLNQPRKPPALQEEDTIVVRGG